MAHNAKQKQKEFKNDLENFDLDQYIEEQIQQSASHTEPSSEEHPSYRKKNMLLVAGVIVAAVLWFNSWNPAQMWQGLFGGNDQSAGNTQTFVVPDVPSFDVPPVPPIPSVSSAPSVTELDMSLTEYLSALRDNGLLNDQIGTFEARQLFSSNVPVSYLQDLNNAGFLADLSFVDISSYYQNSIPISYLEELRNAGFFADLSFVDITNFYQNEVPIDYLVKLNDAGFLEDLSFVYITQFYSAGVTVDFLKELRDSGIYDELNFLDVIEMYKNREN